MPPILSPAPLPGAYKHYTITDEILKRKSIGRNGQFVTRAARLPHSTNAVFNKQNSPAPGHYKNSDIFDSFSYSKKNLLKEISRIRSKGIEDNKIYQLKEYSTL